jgi:hypothetical protein
MISVIDVGSIMVFYHLIKYVKGVVKMKVNLGKYKKTSGNRKEEVRIDEWDTWSLDHDLARIIHPALIKLKECEDGSPFVEDVYVPDHLKSTAATPKENEWDIDDNYHARWDYILDEMIWSFGEYNREDRESQFYSGESDLSFIPIDKDNNIVDEKDANYFRWVDGPNSTFKVDKESEKVYEEKISNGIKLFAIFYGALWS